MPLWSLSKQSLCSGVSSISLPSVFFHSQAQYLSPAPSLTPVPHYSQLQPLAASVRSSLFIPFVFIYLYCATVASTPNPCCHLIPLVLVFAAAMSAFFFLFIYFLFINLKFSLKLLIFVCIHWSYLVGTWQFSFTQKKVKSLVLITYLYTVCNLDKVFSHCVQKS